MCFTHIEFSRNKKNFAMTHRRLEESEMTFFLLRSSDVLAIRSSSSGGAYILKTIRPINKYKAKKKGQISFSSLFFCVFAQLVGILIRGAHDTPITFHGRVEVLRAVNFAN